MLYDELLLAAVISEKERQVKQLLEVRSVKRSRTTASQRGRRAWHWRVEPGMEEEFSRLHGWFLSGVDDMDG